MGQCLTPGNRTQEYTDYYGKNRTINYPCGKCVSCLKRRSSQWSFRLGQEAQVSSSASFLTLTYENTPISENGFPTLQKRDWQLFMKKLRKKTPLYKLKFYACGEYGTKTYRPHYHAIIFNLPHRIISKPQIITDLWGHGHTMITHSNDLTINYVSGYIMKNNIKPINKWDDRQKEFSLMSKKMGLSYLTPQMIKWYRDRELTAIQKENGQFISMPRYYKEKIFNKQELKKIYADLLNHMEYVETEPVKIRQIIKKHIKELKSKRLAI
jgi:hypothetical protein